MWGWKRQKVPPETEEADLSEIIPKITLERIIVPPRYMPRNGRRHSKASSGRKKQSMDQRYGVNVNDIRDVNKIINTHK